MDQENHSTRFSVLSIYNSPECPLPRPFLSLDVIWNLGFVLVAGVVLLTSVHERPSTPLRLWIGGYALQCLLHLAFLLVHHQRPILNPHHIGFIRALQSINTVISSVWWAFGLYWIYMGGQPLVQNSPRLCWLSVVFVALDLFFMILRMAMASIVFFLLVCFWPILTRVAYALGTGSNGASEDDIRRLPEYRYRQANTCGAFSDCEKQEETGVIAYQLGRNNSSMPELVLSSEDSECCICLSSYEDGVRLCTLPCDHHFHYQCIGKWLRINATCPLCKSNIFHGEMLV